MKLLWLISLLALATVYANAETSSLRAAVATGLEESPEIEAARRRCSYRCPKDSFKAGRGCPNSFKDCTCKSGLIRDNLRGQCVGIPRDLPTRKPTPKPTEEPTAKPTGKPTEPQKPIVIPGPDFRNGLVCHVEPSPGNKVTGTVTFLPFNKATIIAAKLSNLEPGTRSWHIHEFGDLSADDRCSSAGGHYNPLGVNHGAPENDARNRHIGDLGNFKVNQDGTATIYQIDPLVKLENIIGRGLVIHGGQDDLGKGGNAASLAAGNSGPRIGCCVIGIPNRVV